ncbi:hypothetical protein LIER_32832 [Lithospermum erythrorhizon]|uniref:Fungal lipase-type domain-containing protein n=1 Tax=Lithospermum erythrorhizon TaxID=34254 RepID=A0AAV3RVW9_LITER
MLIVLHVVAKKVELSWSLLLVKKKVEVMEKMKDHHLILVWLLFLLVLHLKLTHHYLYVYTYSSSFFMFRSSANINQYCANVKGTSSEFLYVTENFSTQENVGKREVDEANCETVFLSELKQEGADVQGNGDIEEEVTSEAESELTTIPDKLMVDDKSAEEIRDIFSKAEGAMEAWAMLSTSLGHPSFIKSEFENICFLDNPSSDTQVVLWRDSKRNRLVVAFRGTEQTKWKDLLTDLMLVPAGFNPEGIGGDSKEEVEVHGGFLSAYDSVRTRLILLIKQAIGYIVDDVESFPKWHVYVTGHSLGGALATLLAHELSSGELSKSGAISVTMYNFGSPRVGNRKFAEVYNKKIKDSWRVVNHRDIVPTVPRLMGYCHVNQPMYLDAGDLEDSLETVEQMEDGHQSDDIGEATPDVLVSELMKGEIELIEKILNTEINTFHAMKDGSALMQHMEDFYYISLLEKVRYELSQKHS